MSSSGGVFSQTLKEITTTKLEELAKKRASFEHAKSATITDADNKQNPIDMLIALSEGTRKCFGVRVSDEKVVRGSSRNPRLETDLHNLSRFIDQARFDPSVSIKIIQQWRKTLIDHLDVQSLKYQYADLYGQLTVEWLTSSKPQGKDATDASSEQASAIDNDDFEQVAVKAKLEARRQWESTVFEEVKVDKKAIEDFLNQTFQGDEIQKALETLRRRIKLLEDDLSGLHQFNHTTLTWSIKGLLASDSLTNEKRGVLRDFLSNTTILNELADVLNMRMAALESWSWGAEVAVEARRELNGQFKIHMHEDLLQAIFLQYIGVKWSVKFKSVFNRFVATSQVWKSGRTHLSPLDQQRRKWYFYQTAVDKSVQKERRYYHLGGYFVSQLLNSEEQDLSTEEGDVEADFDKFAVRDRVAKKKARLQASMVAVHDEVDVDMLEQEKIDYDEDMGFGLFDEDDDPPNLDAYRPANPMAARQRLLHLLSTEILVKTRVDGDVTAFRSQYDPWNPSLPHSTVDAVLTYFGVSPKWLDFFRTFLEAPLKFIDEDAPPRLRKRGTPDSCILSDVFGETILFCLDFAINQQTEGEFLWRMNNDLWFWSSSHEVCVNTWKTIGEFNKTMGIALDDKKSAAVRFQRKDKELVPAKLHKSLPEGRIRWGMLYLDSNTGRFTIDRAMVDEHIEELRRQLKDKERSIFAWVRAYSTYASVFFTTNFGKPANCFGREHIDMILGMHERIQKTLFSASAEGSVTSVVDWLKKQIDIRFGVKDIPDGYLFFPTELGGLDVKSPFIGPLQLRNSVTKDPNALLDDFEREEQSKYNHQKNRYLSEKPWEYPQKDDEYRPDNPEEFMPFEEFTKYREKVYNHFNNELLMVYEKLLREPGQEPLENDHTPEIDEALHRARSPAYHTGNSISYWNSMDAYWKWVTMLYGPEMIQRFGGFEIVDSGLLPMGMVSMFKDGRVSWQD